MQNIIVDYLMPFIISTRSRQTKEKYPARIIQITIQPKRYSETEIGTENTKNKNTPFYVSKIVKYGYEDKYQYLHTYI